MNQTDRNLVLFMQSELVAARVAGADLAHLNTMPACRGCSWELKHRGPLWVCENWRPWNFWRHEVTRRPTRRVPCM